MSSSVYTAVALAAWATVGASTARTGTEVAPQMTRTKLSVAGTIINSEGRGIQGDSGGGGGGASFGGFRLGGSGSRRPRAPG
jgi:hypothetical protein